MKFLVILFCCAWSLNAGTLRIEIQNRFEGKPLTLGSLRYSVNQNDEIFSITRLSYLLSEFSLQRAKGDWVTLSDQFAWLDASRRRNTFSLTDVPSGDYKAVRFSVGVPQKENHADISSLAPDHPLNPNLNQLHWSWAGGYIFMALEGRYRTSPGDLQGFVYHLANDANLSPVHHSIRFRVKKNTALGFSFDLKKLLSVPRPLSFEKDGASTHSPPGDAIASSLLANLQGSFSVLGASYPPEELPQRTITPLYLPGSYTPYSFKMSRRFPMPSLPRDNPLLEERVSLGESLFHDQGLSGDGAISCASCHDPALAFSDNRALSSGAGGRIGQRNAMPLFNLAWKSSFFWDGRAKSLREQVLLPIQDHREMNSVLEDVVTYLEKTRRSAFEKAFGAGDVTAEKISLALENYLLTLTSYDSKFDRAMSGKEKLTNSEQRGMELFFTEYEPRSGQLGADCFHCHGGANFSDHQFHDNGLGEVLATPSLRNLTLTKPYMHDGRFSTLEEVISHYNGPMERTGTLDPNLAKHPKMGLQLKASDQQALVDFLRTLTDPKFQK